MHALSPNSAEDDDTARPSLIGTSVYGDLAAMQSPAAADLLLDSLLDTALKASGCSVGAIF